VSTTLNSINDTVSKFATGTTCVVDNGLKFAIGINDTSGKYATGVVDTDGVDTLTS
jgi:hypothetical protein